MNERSLTDWESPVPVTSSRQEQILDAAALCFARGGFHATTVAEISHEAGCSAGLIYRYFAGKDALIEALVNRDCERLVVAVEAAVHRSDPVSALVEVGTWSLQTYDTLSTALYLEVLAEAARNPRVTVAIHRCMAGVTSALAETLRQGQQSGTFDRSLEPHTTARALIAMVDGLGMQQVTNPREGGERPFEVEALIRKVLTSPADENTQDTAELSAERSRQ